MSNLIRRNSLVSFFDNSFFPVSIFDSFGERLTDEIRSVMKPTRWVKDISDYPMNIVNIKEDGKIVANRLEYALAGFKKEEIHVTRNDNILTVTAEHKSESNENESSEYNGISYKKMQQSYRLTDNASKEDITSKFEDGILKVTIPFKKEEKDDSSVNIDIL